MKKIAIFVFVFVYFTSFAQRSGTAYFEFLGTGFPYSFNFDAPFKKENTTFGYRIGAGYVRGSKGALQVPVMINFVRGNKHSLEIGVGLFNSIQSVNSRLTSFSYPSGCVAYRFQGDGGFNLRIGWNPIIIPQSQGSNYTSSGWFLFMPCLSLGYRL
jgi:hypothetical protein